MSKLNKGDLVGLLAEKLGTTKKEAGEIHDTFVELLEEVVVQQQAEFKLGNIGTFKVPVKPEREYRNPQSGESVVKPAHFALQFKASANIKRELEQYEV